MHDIWPTMEQWIAEGRQIAMARVLQAWGSAPRRAGATMLVDGAGRVAGSVSGGCVEGAVVETAASIVEGAPATRLSFGVEDEEAWSLGLSCGGAIAVFVEPHWVSTSQPENRDTWAAVKQAHDQNEPLVVVTRIDPAPVVHAAVSPGGRLLGGSANLPGDLLPLVDASLGERRCRVHETSSGSWFLHVLPRKDLLLIVGAGHIAVCLVELARGMGFETVVIDPRCTFADTMRFSVQPNRLIAEWPQQALDRLNVHGDAYAVVLTHDPKIDDPALHRLLRSDACYIGALGSRRTHEKRCARLEKAGFSPDDIGRIHGPVGVDIGAASPAEIALSILAEIVSVKRSGGCGV